MTKIEEYKQAKWTACRISESVSQALGRDDTRNDKHSITVSFTGLASGAWSDMQFRVHASYGYYGSSSGYSATSDGLGQYLAKSIQKHAALLLDFASKLAAEDAEKARKAAEDEARSVLTETAA